MCVHVGVPTWQSHSLFAALSSRGKRDIASVSWTSMLSWDLPHHSVSHLPQFPKSHLFFFRGCPMSVLSKATAICTVGEIRRGKVFEHTPLWGEAFIISVTRNKVSWVLVWHWKTQNYAFSVSAFVSWGSASASLWLSLMSLQISSDGGCDELPGGWCSAGVLGMVTSSPSRKGLDSYNIYHEPVPEIVGTKSTGAMVHVRWIDEVFRDMI